MSDYDGVGVWFVMLSYGAATKGLDLGFHFGCPLLKILVMLNGFVNIG